MVRPVLPREPSEQVTTLSRMIQQVEVDGRYSRSRRRLLVKKLTELVSEFQKEVVSRQGYERNGSERTNGVA